MNFQLTFSEISKLTEDEARKYLEKLRWYNGIFCPHCDSKEAYKLTPKSNSKRPVRNGVYKCKSCRKQFTVTVGTIFEGSHIPLVKWLMAVHLLCASKKGISAHQLHRMLGITYKSAWFMAHRIRYAMTQPELANKLKGIVEADETYIGSRAKGKRGRGAGNKMIVFTLVERNGNVQSMPVERVTAKNLKGIIRKSVDKNSIMITDEFASYKGLEKEYKEHHIINHGLKEYARGNVHTNNVEGYFSLLKRGINGTFHHISKQHLLKYLNEFDFRHNYRKLEDNEKVIMAVICSEGKRLFYRKNEG